MLANVLAVIVGTGSLAFYLIAFVLPEVHRRSDFFWSGVGMFYAVVLWSCARQMQGGVLLGQSASVGLLLWLGYQTLLLRRETTPAAQQTPIRLGKSERRRFNGTTSRPIAKDYEFVEDGVEDPLDQALDDNDPDSPILLKPAPDEFAPKMVVPAAMPKPNIKENIEENAAETASKEAPAQNVSAPQKTAKKRKKTNPLGAVGIFTGWLKDVVTPKKKPPQPMLELPPRPPSIPKPDQVSDRAITSDSSDQSADGEKPEVTAANLNPAPISSDPDTSSDKNLLFVDPDTSSAPNTSSDKNMLSAKDTLPAPDILPVPDTSSAPDTSAISANLEPFVADSAPATVPATSSTETHPDDDEDSNWPEDEFWE